MSKKSSAITVLGIDPGLDRTGYAVLEIATRRVVEAGLVRSSTALPLARRLREIEAGLEEILIEHPVDLVAVEELYAHYKHPRTAILMGHARGVVLLAAARRGVDIVSLPATHVKRSLTGNGHASKLQMQRAILTTMHLSVMPEPPDVADAVAIAWCGGELVKNRNVETPKLELKRRAAK
ncbi:MAG: crossover junction endodeoxyribonuclease RuvC [Planctomycetes bacterium]|nr:crossover junction endodeoxyribonuclease RuvC [Planctomycetota bacterium]